MFFILLELLINPTFCIFAWYFGRVYCITKQKVKNIFSLQKLLQINESTQTELICNQFSFRRKKCLFPCVSHTIICRAPEVALPQQRLNTKQTRQNNKRNKTSRLPNCFNFNLFSVIDKFFPSPVDTAMNNKKERERHTSIPTQSF